MKTTWGIYSNVLKGFLTIESYNYCFRTNTGKRLEFKSEEIANYAIDGFKKIYVDWFIEKHEIFVKEIREYSNDEKQIINKILTEIQNEFSQGKGELFEIFSPILKKLKHKWL